MYKPKSLELVKERQAKKKKKTEYAVTATPAPGFESDLFDFHTKTEQ